MKLKNSALQELYDVIVNGTLTFSPYEECPIDKAFRECDEKLSDSVTFTHIKDLQDRNDILRKSEAALLKANVELASKKRQFEKDLDDAKKQLNYFTHSRDDWRSRAKHAEKEVEDLKKEKKWFEEALQDTQTTLVKANDDRANLLEAVDKLSGENRSLNARIDCLRMEVEWYRKHYRENLNKVLNTARDDGYKKGQKDLWDMLQNVNDAKPFELATCFPDVTCMDDILSWNLEDFLDAYESWQDKKDQERTKYIRDYLERFCRGRLCSRCPLLGSDEYKCRCAYSFNGAHPIPDEDIERYYEKVKACSKPGKTSFETWTCTLEGTVEIDKDLLNKICGIDSDN